MIFGMQDNISCDWTIHHSWYLIMGGSVLRTAVGADGQEYIPGSLDLVLKLGAFHFLVERRRLVIPAIKENTIKDFGKADSLAKALVCLQALCLIVQCISRVAMSLPVSQLEISACSHALCALLMYIFWYRKLKDVRSRTVVQHEMAHDLAAHLWKSSPASQQCLVPNKYGASSWVADPGIRNSNPSYFLTEMGFERTELGGYIKQLMDPRALQELSRLPLELRDREMETLKAFDAHIPYHYSEELDGCPEHPKYVGQRPTVLDAEHFRFANYLKYQRPLYRFLIRAIANECTYKSRRFWEWVFDDFSGPHGPEALLRTA